MENQPSVTIITVVYNAESLVDRTMKSVWNQSWPNMRQVVVDGGSQDKTLDVVARYTRPGLKVVSERDNGIYDAMNKGLHLSDGDYILFLNAGDELFSPTTISDMINAYPGADVYYGNTAVVDESGQVLGDRRLSPPDQLNWKSLQYGMVVSHQSLLVKRTIAVDYDLRYRISADIDWTIRVLKKANQIVNSKIVVSRFLEGGVSSSRRKEGLKERYQIMSEHYGGLKTFLNHGYILIRFLVHRISRKSMT